jgi:excisionase family DNA binding protein
MPARTISTPSDPVQAAVLRPPYASAYLGISRSYLYLLIERGELPLLKLGGRASGVMRSDCDAWLNKQRAIAIAVTA